MCAIRVWYRLFLMVALLVNFSGCRGTTEEGGQETSPSFSPVRAILSVLSLIRPEQPDTVKTMEEHADLFAAQKRDDLAEKHYRLALTIRESAWGKEHANVLPGLDKLIHFYTLRERYAAAAALAQDALVLHEKLVGEKHPDLIPRLQAYASILHHMQRTTDAKALEGRAQTIQRQGKTN